MNHKTKSKENGAKWSKVIVLSGSSKCLRKRVSQRERKRIIISPKNKTSGSFLPEFSIPYRFVYYLKLMKRQHGFILVKPL